MRNSAGKSNDCKPVSRSGGLGAWILLIAIAVCTAVAFTMGWHEHLTLKTIGLNYEALKSFIDEHFLVALAIYTLAYVAVVALSLPGGLVMTLTGGLLFGWALAAPASIAAATMGATIIFLAAKTTLSEALAAKAAPWLCKLSEGFKANAFSYLLFLRLVPAFPFFVVNLVPALLGVPLRTYVLATAVGIIPGTYAFAVAGTGLGSVIEAQNAAHSDCLAEHAGDPEACSYVVDTGALVTKEILIAFLLLGIVALIPVVIKKWSKRDAHV